MPAPLDEKLKEREGNRQKRIFLGDITEHAVNNSAIPTDVKSVHSVGLCVLVISKSPLCKILD